MSLHAIKSWIGRARGLAAVPDRTDRLQQALGRIELRQCEDRNLPQLNENEFRVFSQFGEDGIIQFLLRRIGSVPKRFVEFGVEDYREANTRFLLLNDYWQGLVIDGSAANVQDIHRSGICWARSLTALHSFVTTKNINDLITQTGFSGDLGLLSVDIDGNDYWVWDAITCVNPVIVICEYNSIFGWRRQVSIPYDPQFVRRHAHYSQVYYGASLSALTRLAEQKGYALVGTNKAGNNAFFVRSDCLRALSSITPEAAFRASCFQEAVGEDGRLTYLNHQEQRALIAHLPLVDVETGATLTVRDIGETG
jgi:hypothetical protein